VTPDSSEPSPAAEQGKRAFRRFARAGFAINGLIHFLIGGITLRLALGARTVESADQAGALDQISNLLVGRLLLWVAFGGLAALALWQLTQASGKFEELPPARRWGRRVVEIGKGIVYLFLAGTVLLVLFGSNPEPSDTIRAADGLMNTVGGVILIVGIGLAFIGAGIGFIVVGIRRTFTKLIHLPVGRGRRFVLVIGVVGYLAKGVALGIVGVVLNFAAMTGDASRASGLDGALRALMDIPFGSTLVGFVGVGLILYGLFLVVRTRLARL
jgi:hypothetical protein